jgi:hypothetical protein
VIELCDTVAFDVMPEVVELAGVHAGSLSGVASRSLGRVVGEWWCVRAGVVMEVQEILHGKPRRLRLALTKAGPGRWIGYRVLPGLSGGFGVSPVSCGSEFTAVIGIGVRAPIIGPIVGWLLRRTVEPGSTRSGTMPKGANLMACWNEWAAGNREAARRWADFGGG